MYYVLIDYAPGFGGDAGQWKAEGLDGFDCTLEERGDDGPTLDRLKHKVFHAVQEANDGHTIIVKWVYRNHAHARHRRLLNEHMKKPEDAAAKLLADAGVTEDDDKG